VPIKVVSERLGHSKVAMTLDVYAHVLPAADRAAAEVIGALVRGSTLEPPGSRLAALSSSSVSLARSRRSGDAGRPL
jgi:hypothetical protein